MTWTPLEDAALLRAKASHCLPPTPALQQMQWQEVAFYVTASNGAVVRLADECHERYNALLEAARNTEKNQWPGDEKIHELLQVALEREGNLRGVGPTPARGGAKENGRPTTLSSGSAGLTGLATPRAATSKRPRQDDAPPILTCEHDEIILRVAAETTSASSEEWLWRKMTKCAKEESVAQVPARVWKTRYHELFQMSDEAIQSRFEGNQTLCQLLNRARRFYESRMRLTGRGFADTSTCRPVPQATEMPFRHENRSELCPYLPTVTSSTVKTPAASPSRPWTPHGLEQETTRNKANESPQRKVAAPSNNSKTSQTRPESLVENISSPQPQVEAEIEPEAQHVPRTAEEDIVELKKTVALMTSDLMLVRGNVAQVTLENTQLKRALTALRVEVNDTSRVLAATAKEMATLRAKLELATVNLTALQAAAKAKPIALIATMRREWIDFQDEQRATIEEISSILRTEIESVTKANTTTVDELSKKCRENTAAELQRQTILFEMVETELLKREELEAQWKKHQAKYKTDKRDLDRDIEKLRAKCERGQQARDESMIRFQEEIQQQHTKLQDQLSHELTKYDQLLLTTQGELKSGLEGLHAATIKQQDDAKRHSLDQYVHTTLQLHELRNAIDKERQERSQEFTILLQNIQRLTSSD